MTILVNIPISGRDGNTLFEISFNHCPPRLQKIWFVSSALQSNTLNFTATSGGSGYPIPGYPRVPGIILAIPEPAFEILAGIGTDPEPGS